MTLRNRIATLVMAASRSPMLHFAAIGAGLFIIYAWLGLRPSPAGPDRQIIVPPRSDAMFVEDEVLYREAVALGLHAADPIVRRRLIQKMRFLLEDTAPVPEPTDAEMIAYLEDERARFQVPETYDLQLRFFSRDRRTDPTGDAKAALVELGAGKSAAGDGFVHGNRFRNRSPAQLARTFGPAFAQAIASLPVDRWAGPVESSFGVHLVRVERKRPHRVPPLSEIRSRVRAAIMRERRARKVRAAIDVMRARYHIEHPQS